MAKGENEYRDEIFAIGGNTAARLRSFIERIEKLEEERRGIAEDIKEVKAEAKVAGFDINIITYLIKLRRQDADDRAEFEAIVDTYKRALGMTQ
jgi:uncharacterized protein (UPF0335 family)